MRGGGRLARRLAEGRGGVYHLVDGTGKTVYIGRTVDFARREAQHLADPVKGRYEFRPLETITDWTTLRGREEQRYLDHIARFGSPPQLNKIRPVDLNNPMRPNYMKASKSAFPAAATGATGTGGSEASHDATMAPFSPDGDNWDVENDVLDDLSPEEVAESAIPSPGALESIGELVAPNLTATMRREDSSVGDYVVKGVFDAVNWVDFTFITDVADLGADYYTSSGWFER